MRVNGFKCGGTVEVMFSDPRKPCKLRCCSVALKLSPALKCCLCARQALLEPSAKQFKCSSNSTHRKFLKVFSQISDLIVAANVGVMLFFSVAVAPTIFRVLPPQWSAAYVRKFFPKYFLFLGITSAVAAALHSLPVAQLSLAACAVVFFFSVFWLTPRINAARDNQQTRTFNTLHYTNVGLNLIQLAVMIWLLVKSVLAA